MDKTIKRLAVCSAVALATAACAPTTYSPYDETPTTTTNYTPQVYTPPVQPQTTVPVNRGPATTAINTGQCWHGRNERGQCNPDPRLGQTRPAATVYQPQPKVAYTPPPAKPVYQPPAPPAYQPPAPQPTPPAYQPPPPQQSSNTANYYDYASAGVTGVTASTTTANTGPESYYDYGTGNTDTTNTTNYYDQAQPKPLTDLNYSGVGNTNNTQPAAIANNSGSFTPSYAGGNTYTVKRGDTVFQVMRNTGVYWKDIIRINNLQAPNYQINPGQVLRLR